MQHDAHVEHYRAWLLACGYIEMWRQGALDMVELWEQCDGRAGERARPR